jgi:hypothetical protein
MSYLPQTAQELEEFIQTSHFKRMHLENRVEVPECVEIDDIGDRYRYPHTTGYYRTWLANQVAQNRSRVSFTRQLLAYLAETGIALQELANADAEQLAAAKQQHKECRTQVDLEQAAAIANAVVLTEDEFEQANNADRGQMVAEDRLSVELASLCKAWLLPLDEQVSAQWVLDHDDQQAKAVF